jgi:hypothetical protein
MVVAVIVVTMIGHCAVCMLHTPVSQMGVVMVVGVHGQRWRYFCAAWGAQAE